MQGCGEVALGCSSPNFWKWEHTTASESAVEIIHMCGEYVLLTHLHHCQGWGSSALQIFRKAMLSPTAWHRLSQFCYGNKTQSSDCLLVPLTLPSCMICSFQFTSVVKNDFVNAPNFTICPRPLNSYCLHLTAVLCSCYGAFLFIKWWGKFQDQKANKHLRMPVPN